MNAPLAATPAQPVCTIFDSPLGPIRLQGDGTALSRVHFLLDGGTVGVNGCADRAASLNARGSADDGAGHSRAAYPEARRQLSEYFAGERREFELPLKLNGTEWQLKVWQALLRIPYGQTRSYGEIAREVCTIRASRAVRLANGSNPVAIIVPCHRVIGSDRTLTGYAAGLANKRALLDLESGRGSLFQ